KLFMESSKGFDYNGVEMILGANLSDLSPKAYHACLSVGGVEVLTPEKDAEMYRSAFARQSGVKPYRNNLGYHLQATRGTPLRYHDGENLISLGFGRDGCPVVAVGPMGPEAAEKTRLLAEAVNGQGVPFYVKKVLPEET